MPRLDGQVAFVTGGASGIGKAICEAFHAEGANVAIGDIDVSAGTNLADSIGAPALFVEHDVTNEAQWASGVGQTIERFGRLDIVVNNAGIALSGSIESISIDSWLKTFSIYLTGAFLGCRAAIAAMKKNGGGSIINISSLSAYRADPGTVAYNASKAGLTMMTKSVALHCARERLNIRCNSIHPGVIQTAILDKYLGQLPNPDEAMQGLISLHPIGRIGDPSDVANVAVFLASQEAKFVTGSAYAVDGGASI
jgi:NAD(P)-dependent dehydrogenase (short-subunit alcohol dehydrogenase family)